MDIHILKIVYVFAECIKYLLRAQKLPAPGMPEEPYDFFMRQVTIQRDSGSAQILYGKKAYRPAGLILDQHAHFIRRIYAPGTQIVAQKKHLLIQAAVGQGIVLLIFFKKDGFF